MSNEQRPAVGAVGCNEVKGGKSEKAAIAKPRKRYPTCNVCLRSTCTVNRSNHIDRVRSVNCYLHANHVAIFLHAEAIERTVVQSKKHTSVLLPAVDSDAPPSFPLAEKYLSGRMKENLAIDEKLEARGLVTSVPRSDCLQLETEWHAV